SDKINLLEGFEIGEKNVIQFFESIPNDKLEYRYQPEKWTIKEVFQHLIDTERIFMYRCFRIARNDKTALTGYNQNIYIEPSGANKKSINALLNEFKVVRQSSISLLNSLTDEDLCNVGTSSNVPMSARAAAYIIIGHDIWHMDVIKEKYL
ncbi:MAG: DinB family protein, partial [Flavobacteriaceae bacterium]|nr:DinB family protein [Flavobacteriaceae bacterium]